MAKKKRSKRGASAMQSPSSPSSPRRVNIGLEEAENGFVVHASSEGGPSGEYKSKTLVAPNHTPAIRISNAHLQTLGSKLKTKHRKASKMKIPTGKRT